MNPERVASILNQVSPVRIVIPGAPASYQKAVMTWHSKDGRSGTHAYDRAGYRQWRDYARGRAAEICEQRPVSEAPVIVTINAYFLPPKSMSQKMLAMAYRRLIRPMKLDVDNICKAVADSVLTGIVIRDDKQIVEAHISKWYDQNPRVEVEIHPWLPQEPSLFRE
jgi:Holliday junction resolvase RusA-like endonuclease